MSYSRVVALFLSVKYLRDHSLSLYAEVISLLMEVSTHFGNAPGDLQERVQRMREEERIQIQQVYLFPPFPPQLSAMFCYLCLLLYLD
jgi:hypothetical protein